MRAMVTAVCALALVGSTGTAFAQAPGETIDVGGWKVSQSRDAGGAFQGCTATMTFDDGSVVGVAANSSANVMVVSEPKSGLTADQKYQVKYSFDGGKQTTATGQATGKDGMLVPIPDPDMELFMSAKTLHLSYGGTDYEEPLDGSKDALMAVARCIAANAS